MDERTDRAERFDDLLDTWATAERTGDAPALARLLTDDFVGIGPVGFVLDRFDQGLRYESLTVDEVSIRRHGDAAVAVVRQHAVGTARGHAIPDDTRVSLTIVRDDEPRIAAVHYSYVRLSA
jgi:ketosteroid isomerase-like protein